MNIVGYDFSDLGRLALLPTIGLAILFVAKLISDRLTPFDDNKTIEEEGNTAYAMRRVGMFLALALGIAGAIRGLNRMPFPDSAMWVAISASLAALLVGACILIGRKLTFPKVSMREAAANQNLAIAYVELGARVAIGVIAYAAFQGEGDLSDGIVFMILAQLALVASFYVYELVTRYNMREELMKGNGAAGITAGGWMLSLGLILAAAISGPSEDWITDISLFAMWSVFGLVLLIAVKWVADLLFLPKSTSEQQVAERKNVAAAGLLTGLNISLALIIATTIL